jgi:hypothetical protein
MAADEDDCVSYACECVRLAVLTDDEVIREELLKLARCWIVVAAMRWARIRPEIGVWCPTSPTAALSPGVGG